MGYPGEGPAPSIVFAEQGSWIWASGSCCLFLDSRNHPPHLLCLGFGPVSYFRTCSSLSISSSLPWLLLLSLSFLAPPFLSFLGSLHFSVGRLVVWSLSVGLGCVCLLLCAVLLVSAVCWARRSPVGWLMLVVAVSPHHALAMPVFPKTPGDHARARLRSERIEIPVRRLVLPMTADRRDKHLREFLDWCVEEGLEPQLLFENHQVFIDDINMILERFGRQLYAAGKPYAHYAETTNSITSWKPALRRLLQGAWSFGFSWVRHEPTEHHVAMPGSVALAILASALVRGLAQICGGFCTDVGRPSSTS